MLNLLILKNTKLSIITRYLNKIFMNLTHNFIGCNKKHIFQITVKENKVRVIISDLS